MFYRIVVATDFSDCAKEALELAKRLAAARAAAAPRCGADASDS